LHNKKQHRTAIPLRSIATDELCCVVANSKGYQFGKPGERILVNEHDGIVAEIIPSTVGQSESNLLEEYLSDKVKYGFIVRAKKKIKLKKAKSERKLKKVLLEEIYNKTRADRV